MKDHVRCAVSIVLTGLLLATLVAACGPAATPAVTSAPTSPPPGKSPTSQAAATPPPPEQPIHIVFFVPLGEDPWYVGAVTGAEQRAEDLGVELDVFDAAYDTQLQMQQFDTAMIAGPDAIVLSSVDPAGMVSSVERAHDAGIVVVNYDRPMWSTTKLDANLILDTPQIGIGAAEATVEYLTEKYGEPRGKVMRVYGDIADTWVTDISEGWDPEIAKYPDIEVLSASSGPWAVDQAAASVEQLLSTHNDVDAIFSDGETLVPGVISSLEAAGYGRSGEENHIFLVACGGSAVGLDYIRDGWMDATMSTPIVDFAGVAVEVAYMLAKGEALPTQWVEEGRKWSPAEIFQATPTADEPYDGPVLNMKNELVDRSNVDDPMLWGNLAAEE